MKLSRPNTVVSKEASDVCKCIFFCSIFSLSSHKWSVNAHILEILQRCLPVCNPSNATFCKNLLSFPHQATSKHCITTRLCVFNDLWAAAHVHAQRMWDVTSGGKDARWMDALCPAFEPYIINRSCFPRNSIEHTASV